MGRRDHSADRAEAQRLWNVHMAKVLKQQRGLLPEDEPVAAPQVPRDLVKVMKQRQRGPLPEDLPEDNLGVPPIARDPRMQASLAGDPSQERLNLGRLDEGIEVDNWHEAGPRRRTPKMSLDQLTDGAPQPLPGGPKMTLDQLADGAPVPQRARRSESMPYDQLPSDPTAPNPYEEEAPSEPPPLSTPGTTWAQSEEPFAEEEPQQVPPEPPQREPSLSERIGLFDRERAQREQAQAYAQQYPEPQQDPTMGTSNRDALEGPPSMSDMRTAFAINSFFGKGNRAMEVANLQRGLRQDYDRSLQQAYERDDMDYKRNLGGMRADPATMQALVGAGQIQPGTPAPRRDAPIFDFAKSLGDMGGDQNSRLVEILKQQETTRRASEVSQRSSDTQFGIEGIRDKRARELATQKHADDMELETLRGQNAIGAAGARGQRPNTGLIKMQTGVLSDAQAAADASVSLDRITKLDPSLLDAYVRMGNGTLQDRVKAATLQKHASLFQPIDALVQAYAKKNFGTAVSGREDDRLARTSGISNITNPFASTDTLKMFIKSARKLARLQRDAMERHQAWREQNAGP